MIRMPLTIAEKNSSVPRSGALVDTFGRVHRKIRISLTDKCNLRCIYCMTENTTFLHENALLSSEEIVQTLRLLYSLGIHQVRLTGGEPLLRKDIVGITKLITSISQKIDLSLTTNGILLQNYAKDLFYSGIKKINISLDSLNESQFNLLSKRCRLKDVLIGINNAISAGFPVIKINSVIIKNNNEDQVIPLARYALENNLELRFIESMPIGANQWDSHQLISRDQIIDLLTAYFGPMEQLGRHDSSPAELWRTRHGSIIGIIASVSKPFCNWCDRLRLTADGFVRACLFSVNETDIKPFLRPKIDLIAIESAFRSAVWQKSEGHQISSADFIKPHRTMHAIGG